MDKYVCSVCGYVYEGEKPLEKCPICNVSADKIKKMEDKMQWADEHRVGIASDAASEVLEELRANFMAECTETGMYLAMSRQADREGYPEIGETYQRIAYEEAMHGAKFAELLGEVLGNSTKENLKTRIDAEYGACEGKKKLASLAKQHNLDAIHDTVHEMAKDEARHGCVFKGLLERYFKNNGGIL